MCEMGKNQSPIDIRDTAKAQLPALHFSYATSVTTVTNYGHTIQADFAPGSFLEIGKRKFQLVQMHFHVPSENLITGRQYAMEGHLVHQSAEGALAVVAVMFEAGKEQDAISRLWYQMPEKAGDSVPFGGKLMASEVLPPEHGYFYFSGSLTTPPCSEGVSWIVLKQPVAVSKGQIDHFARVIGHPNNRPVQPVNARIVDD